MFEDKKYTVSFEIKEIVASTMSEFTTKVEELIKNDVEISDIVAVVVTKKLL